MSASLDEVLVSRQVVLVTGKGGVGKSVIAAALALRARDLGLRPLLFECDAPSRMSFLPGGVPATDDVTEVAPGILGINQKSDDAIRDYAAASLPSRAVADLLFENRIARLFLKASPSVSEMALVGRIAYLADKHGQDGPIVVDLHATGHALSLLRAPAGIMKVLRGGGPLYERAKVIEQMLSDPTRAAFVCTALPEELPVTELLELRAQLVELKAPLGPVVLNGVFADPAPAVPDADVATLAGATGPVGHAGKDLAALKAWAKRAAREQARLESALATAPERGQIVHVPWFFDAAVKTTDAGPVSARIASHLAGKRGTT